MVALLTVLVVGASAVTADGAPSRAVRQPGLSVIGVAQDPCRPQQAVPVRAGTNGQFVPGSSVLVTPAGSILTPAGTVPVTPGLASCAVAAEQADQGWLASGLVPGETPAQRSMASQALLDLRLAVRPDGAVVAGWRPGWEYAWPRDSSWVAVALTMTGHAAMAYQILRFLQRVQPASGVWAARYWPDGSGPVRDGRPAELDADGWGPWAVWCWAMTQPPGFAGRAQAQLASLWPMVVRAADAAASSLTSDGLPGPAMDYWESSVAVTLGTAAPLLSGLRAAAALAAGPAAGFDHGAAAADGRRWAAAATRLERAITTAFGPAGYQRTPASGSGADAAITFLGMPFARSDSAVLTAARAAQQDLALPNGGLRPGAAWPGTPGVAWTPETALFALFDAATGQHAAAATLLTWLAAHRTKLGSLPEQVTSTGNPASLAPLSWTDAVTLLALLAQQNRLPPQP